MDDGRNYAILRPHTIDWFVYKLGAEPVLFVHRWQIKAVHCYHSISR